MQSASPPHNCRVFFVTALLSITGVVLAALCSPAYAFQSQAPPPDPATPVQVDNALSTARPDDKQVPEANPARPTVTNPAHIPPVGYLQFEQGFLYATASPGGVAHQLSVVQTTKLAVHPRLMFQVLSQPFAATRLFNPDETESSSRDAGDLLLGVQGLLLLESGHRPTVALGYNHRVRSGSAADIDIGSYGNSANILISGDLGEFHYDSNFGSSEQLTSQVAQTATTSPQASQDTPTYMLRRAQYNQSLSVTHDLLPERFHNNIEITGELWHVTQPLVTTTHSGLPSHRSNAVGALFALGYAVQPNLIVDAGFDHGLTSTSTDWQGFAGFTYLLPHRLWPHEAVNRARGHHHRR